MNDEINYLLREYYQRGKRKIKRYLLQTDKPRFDVFKTAFKKRALLSYISHPFATGIDIHHNNSQDALILAEAIHSLGYSVDVVDFRQTLPQKSLEHYDLILGFGRALSDSFSVEKRMVRIFFATSMNPELQNKLSIRRLKEFHEKYGVWLPESARIDDPYFPLQLYATDGIIFLGSKVIEHSFTAEYSGLAVSVHNSHFLFRDTHEALSVQKNWSLARQHFCLFPAAGLIHKGLDICLEYFAEHKDLHLHFGCSPIREKRFLHLFKNHLSLPNIHYYGFVEMNSKEYTTILDTCGFFLSPSVSEGCPTSVINACSNSKIIPLATPESGLPESQNLIIPMKDVTIRSLHEAITRAQQLSLRKLEQLAINNYQYFSTKHSKENFKKELKEAILAILSQS